MERIGEGARVRLRRALVAAAALHSAAVGAVLLAAPAWGPAFGGFAPGAVPFFVRQGGAFHVVLGIAYWLEWRAAGTVRLLLLAKGAATLFLGATLAAGGAPWSVALSAAGDAALWLCALALRPRP